MVDVLGYEGLIIKMASQWFGQGEREDIIQECWIAAIKSLKSFDEEKGSFKSYASYRIKGEMVRLFGSRKKIDLLDTSLSYDNFINDSDDVTFEKFLRYDEKFYEGDGLAYYIDKLNIKYKQVLVAYYYENYTVEQIARLMNVGKVYIYQLLGYARKELKGMIENVQT